MSYFYCADYDSTTFVTQSVKHISFQFTKKKIGLNMLFSVFSFQTFIEMTAQVKIREAVLD